jgi:tetratricopeptide (TPR) repeat protein
VNAAAATWRIPPAIPAGLAALLLALWLAPAAAPADAGASHARPHLSRAKVFLAAGDYRRALEATQKAVDESPSAESYIYLTYVYQAIDGYLEHLSGTDQWGAVDRLYLNLAFRNPEDLVDPPGGLARMAKEMIQTSVRQQSDLSAAMATKLDKASAERLWRQQTVWRAAHPDRWWSGAPESWNW